MTLPEYPFAFTAPAQSRRDVSARRYWREHTRSGGHPSSFILHPSSLLWLAIGIFLSQTGRTPLLPKEKPMRKTLLAGVAAATLLAPSLAAAQEYPAKAIRMVVPF